MNYQLLKKSLNLEVAIQWLIRDSSDDFYPDPIKWADIKQFATEYLEHRQHNILQVHAVSHLKEYVPKKNSTLREAVWLHPNHRILYLAALHRILPRLDSKLHSEVYSYRLDTPDDPDAYPFVRTMDRWKQFSNDFRQAVLDDATGAVLVTDLAGYFDHISCDQMALRIRSMLAETIDDADNEVIDFLLRLLKMWGNSGFGIPQNLDASSFLGSLYLHNVDHDMVTKRHRFFRWLDDIRVIAQSKKQAIRALHDLQRSLAQYRLFLAGNKIDIYEKGDPKLDELLNVEDDILISQAEEIISSGDKQEIETIVDRLFERLEYHARPEGDEKKFRAFANRLLDAGDYVEVEKGIHERLYSYVIPRLSTHIERSDKWVKMLSVNPNDSVVAELKKLLIDKPSMFDWQRFYLWKLALHLPKNKVTKDLLDKAVLVSNSTLSNNVTSQAIVFLGRHADNTEREALFVRLFTTQKSYVVQRAVLIAIQELPRGLRNSYYLRALELNPQHRELVDYLQQLDSPNYGLKPRSKRHCLEVPKTIERVIKRGIGLSQGKITRFRLSRDDYDY